MYLFKIYLLLRFHTSVLDNFRAACQIIHSSFQMTIRRCVLYCTMLYYSVLYCTVTIRSKELVKSSAQQPSHRPWLNKSLVAVKEQGMLFHFSPR